MNQIHRKIHGSIRNCVCFWITPNKSLTMLFSLFIRSILLKIECVHQFNRLYIYFPTRMSTAWFFLFYLNKNNINKKNTLKIEQQCNPKRMPELVTLSRQSNHEQRKNIFVLLWLCLLFYSVLRKCNISALTALLGVMEAKKKPLDWSHARARQHTTKELRKEKNIFERNFVIFSFRSVCSRDC